MINTVDLDRYVPKLHRLTNVPRNMNEDFHGYFNINNTMVDDLYELIVTRKRAEERTSRLKLNGGITPNFTALNSWV